MIEALVSIVVLSIGLLGVAALQGVGLRASGSASYRSQAAWFATQMIEEARAQRALTIASNPGVISDTAGVACGDAAATPVARWRERIACALPAGQGGVTYSSITQRLIVTVQWDDSRGVDSASTGGNSAASFVLHTAL